MLVGEGLRPEGSRMHEDGPLVLEPRALYDSALAGWARRPGDATAILIYDGPLLVEALVADGMSEEEAIEWIGYNIEGAWLGPGMPMVLNRIAQDKLDEVLESL
jgi:hypothetical protein